MTTSSRSESLKRSRPCVTVAVMASMNVGSVGQRSMTLQVNSRCRPVRLAARHSSLRLLPVVAQLNCGYCVNATARFTPSAFMAASACSLVGGP